MTNIIFQGLIKVIHKVQSGNEVSQWCCPFAVKGDTIHNTEVSLGWDDSDPADINFKGISLTKTLGFCQDLWQI